MKKLLTVTIGIPAHNEENNISKLLDSIVMQDKRDYKLEKVIVACDGCTDSTADIVRKYMKRHKYIDVIDDGKRFGQSGRLNNFYKLNKSDVFVTVDADTTLANKFVLKEIVKPFYDNDVALVGGCDTPAKPKNWVQKMGKTWIDVWYEARKDFNNGVSVNNHKGCASAIRGSVAKKIKISKNTAIGNDDFLYFSVQKMGYKFKFAKKGVVYYTVPATLKEFFVQTTRFLSAKNLIAEYFGDYVYEEYKIPKSNKIKAIIIVFFREPFYLPLAIFFQILLRLFRNRFKENYKKRVWTEIKTSK